MADLAEQGVFGRRGALGFARSTDWRVEADRLLQAARQARDIADKD
jgi:3-hydroxyisobutyrate dehydrogenase